MPLSKTYKTFDVIAATELELANDYLLDNHSATMLRDLNSNSGYTLAEYHEVHSENLAIVRACSATSGTRIELQDVFRNGEAAIGMYNEDADINFSPVLYATAFPASVLNRQNMMYEYSLRYEESREEVIAFPAELTEFGYCRAYIPSNVKNIHYSEVLNILAEAEQEAFMLAVGKALTTEQNGWRYLTVLKGDPKIGKSTLLDAVISHSAELGYTSASFTTLSKQFGLADIISADIAYSDDQSTESLKALITGNTFKTVISGGTVRTESKGKPEANTKSTAAFFANINKFDESVLYTTDEGALDRLMILECMPLAESKVNFYENLQILQEQYDCTEADIFHALFRQACDIYQASSDNLTSTVDKLKERFRFKLIKNIENKFIRVLKSSWLAHKQQTYFPSLSKDTFLDAVCFAAIDLKQNKYPVECSDLVALLNIEGLQYAAQTASDISANQQKLSLTKSIELVLADLRLKSGYKILASAKDISSFWHST
jgi:hypothetical protein